MRRYGLYDATRGLTTVVAAALAGVLLWAATRVGQQSTGRFWAEMAIVAGAGLVLAVASVVAGWTKGLRVRLSAGTLLLGFLPSLVCVGWILMATQPGGASHQGGWQEGRIVSWSHDLGLMNVVHDLGLWHGVLAFGLGLLLGRSLDTVPELVADDVVVERTAVTAPMATPVPMERAAADEPLSAETAQPHTVTVGPRREV